MQMRLLLSTVLLLVQVTATGQADQSTEKTPQLLTLATGLLPATFWRPNLEYSTVDNQGNFWQETYTLLNVSYARCAPSSTWLWLEVGGSYHNFHVEDFQGRPEDLSPMSSWKGEMLQFRPSLQAISPYFRYFQTYAGIGLLVSIPLNDRLDYEYTPAERSALGTPNITAQKNGLEAATGLVLHTGTRVHLSERWQFGLRGECILMRHKYDYTARRGTFSPVSQEVGRSLFARSVHPWLSMELVYHLRPVD